MGAPSTAVGLALVVPGYYVCAGILLFAALTAAAVGLYRGRPSIYLAFAFACIASAGVAAATGAYYLSDSVGGAVLAQRWIASSTLLLVAGMVVFISLYTEARSQRPWMIVLGGWIAVLVVANHVLPYGLRYSSITGSSWLVLPWGERAFRIEGVTSAWSFAYRLLTIVVGLWAMWRLDRQFRTGGRRAAIFLAVCLGILLLSSIQGALIDNGVLRTFHLGAFALVGLALVSGAALVVRLHEQNAALLETARRLGAENELRREAQAQIRERAYRDPLTGLPNRTYVQDNLASIVAGGESPSWGAALALDLDHFKVVNDALSHEVGDDLLREISARLAAAMPAGALLARTGGDQFLAVLADQAAREDEIGARIDILAGDIALALSQPLSHEERVLSLCASIGVVTFPIPGTTAADVIGRAEMALHRAKKRGRNNIQRFVPELQHEAAERFRVVEGLRNAVDANELVLRYQPVVMAHGRVIGAEALMRWRSSEGDVPPARFIPIAEETGLIHSLGEWSLREGCLRLAGWAAAGVPFDGTLAINVSPWQLARPDFVPRLRAIVEAADIDPRRLTLEITESAVLIDVEETVAKLREVRQLGIRIALDDFGTGYSSLALIKDLPLDAIKIDQSFVRHLESGANQHLVRVVVAIGAELGLDVIAEGVETEAERTRLVELGCTRLQGYLYARPMTEPEFVQWLRGSAVAQAGTRSVKA